MSSRYEIEAKRLAKLPRAERFESLISFPTDHAIKIIGRTEGFSAMVKQTLVDLGYPKLVPIERPSAKGKYISLTVTVAVKSGQELDRLYTALEQLPGLSYLL